MRPLWICSLLFLLSGCTPPVYQETTYGLDDFIADSRQISQGKFAILKLEQQDAPCLPALHEPCDEIVVDGDELTFTLYNPRRPDRADSFQMINQRTGFRICDGKVSLPHLGSVEVDGLTLVELQEKVQKAYQEQLPGSQLFVKYQKRRERYVQIIGSRKGMIPVDGKTRLNEVLAKASIPPSSNLFKSTVIREGQQLPVDLYKLIHEGDSAQNIVMQGGDQIFIAQASDAAVMITGEVPKPTVIPTPYGFISLREAIAIAGGIPFTGNQGCIGVIRGDFIRPKIYCLNWQDLNHVSNHSLLLMPGDVVVLSEKPITQWNRFINQVQPSTGAMQTSYDIYQLMRRHH